jgi:AcrR family transcriptional regulator
VARGLLHHYFGSKRELYLAVVERQIRVPDSVPLVPEGVSGDLDSVVATCVDLWLDLVEASGGIWSGATTGFVDSDVSTIFASARDALVERMLDEVPFPPADRVLMRSVLRCFAAMAAVATNEWLEDGQLTRAEVAELLTTSLVGLVQVSVPAMEQTRDTVIPG